MNSKKQTYFWFSHIEETSPEEKFEENQGPDKSGTDISDAILWCVGGGVAIYLALFS